MKLLPTVKQLRYLIALDKDMHFGRAAKASFVTQSAFSLAIKELESILDCHLVDRTNKSVVFTALGKELVSQARLCVRDIEYLVELASEHKEALSGNLTLGIIPTIAPFLLPKILSKLRAQLPNLKLYLREGLTANLYEKLMQGELDVILLALPYDLKNTEYQILFKDRFKLACRKNSELVDPENYRLNRLNSDSVILLDEGHCLRDHALSACRLYQQEKIHRFSASSLLTLIQMVDSDLGITYLPEMAEHSGLLTATKVKMYPLKENSYREIALLWRKGTSRSNEFKILAEMIKNYFSKYISAV
ncbi:Hydrogen peroxide-inducible genes activator =_ OxyR [hydrothermal vent metagenome]|uniref:Hydrogen peroxide-inducible genes activator => OxyR n=1 Tax=hydrothermal vent metagenome TaxID=652676 RepID=A0A3B1A1H0_9ZZZZ